MERFNNEKLKVGDLCKLQVEPDIKWNDRIVKEGKSWLVCITKVGKNYFNVDVLNPGNLPQIRLNYCEGSGNHFAFDLHGNTMRSLRPVKKRWTGLYAVLKFLPT